jgi:drug/metabolite transporter (DMT)-like permease
MNLPPAPGSSARTVHARGLLITALGVLILTPDSLLIRLVAADPWTLTFWRGLLSALGMGLGILCVYREGTARAFRAIGGAGLQIAALFGTGTVIFIYSITHTAVANTLFIISTSPLFTALIAWRLLREPVPRHTWIACLAALVGIGMIAAGGLGAGSLAGDAAALMNAIILASTFSLMRFHRGRDMVPAMALGGVVTALVALPLATPSTLAGADVQILLVMGLVMLPLSFGFMTIGPRYIPAPEVGLMLLMESVLGPLWVWLALGEDPGEATLVGGAVVIAALAGNAVASLRWQS